WVGPARALRYRDAEVQVVPGLTAGPTLADALAHMGAREMPPLPEGLVTCAEGLRAAYAARLSGMGDTGEVPEVPGCTTHFAIIDRAGNMVSHTQTLLSLFGAKMVSPSTGLLMNNGIMWFDPEPGGPNALGPGKACLMNVCPALGSHGEARFALGAAGGRKIVSAVTQLVSFLVDHGLSLGEAFHAPRVDVSGLDAIVVDRLLPEELDAGLSALAPVIRTDRTVLPFAFACASGVMSAGGVRMGCTEPEAPWADTAHEDGETTW
ncbi:gamma-glutamyltransferase, partial [Litorisediminicola beolgyonensis]